MNFSVIFAVSFGLALLMMIPILAWGARSARRATAEWVVRRLPTADDRLVLNATFMDRVWNPSKPPHFDNCLIGPGIATYSREAGPDGDIIHLEFLPRGKTIAEHHRGPIPASAIAGTAASLADRQRHKTLWAMTIARLLILGVSVAVALAVSGSGAAPAVITAGVILALLGPPVAVWIARKRGISPNAT